jgi:hypothetical protein
MYGLFVHFPLTPSLYWSWLSHVDGMIDFRLSNMPSQSVEHIVGHNHKNSHIAHHKQNHRGRMTGGQISLKDLFDPVIIDLNCAHNRVHGYLLTLIDPCRFGSFSFH